MIRINIDKPEALMEKASEVEDRVEQTVTLLMIELEEILMNTAPIKTGELRISHTWSVEGSTGELTNTVPYLQWVLFGRGWVFPVEKKALYWPELPHPVAYARPAPPNDYFSAAVAYIDAKGIVEDSFIEWLIS
ncbi:unknown [Methanobacterium phage psiM2]|uniref:Uncharacterized protein n=1 Tax=Methanobacterium phage psiM2 TaxID=77048 RepID=O80206_METM2|nr:hypothetical protein psiM2p17 [Methanobacterium phage psiM2]AAC27055.1 unknown [Methanobacterium phage psiM2]